MRVWSVFRTSCSIHRLLVKRQLLSIVFVSILTLSFIHGDLKKDPDAVDSSDEENLQGDLGSAKSRLEENRLTGEDSPGAGSESVTVLSKLREKSKYNRNAHSVGVSKDSMHTTTTAEGRRGKNRPSGAVKSLLENNNGGSASARKIVDLDSDDRKETDQNTKVPDDQSESQSPTQRAQKPAKSSEAQRIYAEGLKLLDEADMRAQARKLAFQLFYEAAELGHTSAREWVALGTLMGWGFYQSLPRAHAEFSQLAQEGNPRGQFGLGFMHANGLLVNVSIPHALVYLTFSALGGDELAEMTMGYRYWTGLGVQDNCESALTFYYRVAKKVAAEVSERALTGGPTVVGPMVRRIRLLDEADLQGGLFGFFGGSGGAGSVGEAVVGGLAMNDDLFHYYEFMADKKNDSAQVGLGQLYYYGRHGIEKDYHMALHYFTLAAENGNALAKAYLGEMYMNGNEAVQANTEKGLKLLRESAEEDNALGQTSLAMAYLHGRGGLTPNPLKAMELLIRAADQGWGDAQLALGRLFMGTLGVKADFKLALKYFTLASQQGNTLAFFYLGEMHATGTGVLRSCTTATELFKNVAERGRWSRWFMSAYAAYHAHRYDEAFITYQMLAELGYEVAQSNVAYMLEEGKTTMVDKSEFHARALTHWQRSATQGSTSSRIKLGDYHYYGWGTEVNYAKAIQHYRIASELHRNSQAMFNLAYMHEQGLGMKRDIHLAKRYYDMAAEASIDAKIPVNLALARLSIYFGSDYLREFGFVKFIQRIWHGASSPSEPTTTTQSSSMDSSKATPSTTPSKKSSADELDWDYYAIPIMAGFLLALICYLWIARR